MTTPAQPGPPPSPYGPYAPGNSSFGSAFGNLTSMSDNMAATATAGAGGHFKVDTDALQSAIKTWDQVLDELRGCIAGSQAMTTLQPMANEAASRFMADSANHSGRAYHDHIKDLINKATAEKNKVQTALKAYQQNDSNAASTANHVQGNT